MLPSRTQTLATCAYVCACSVWLWLCLGEVSQLAIQLRPVKLLITWVNPLHVDRSIQLTQLQRPFSAAKTACPQRPALKVEGCCEGAEQITNR